MEQQATQLPTIDSSIDAIIDEVNCLARSIYMMHGEVVGEGFKFYRATTELAVRCWQAAVIAYYNAVCVDLGSDTPVHISEILKTGGKTGRFCVH